MAYFTKQFIDSVNKVNRAISSKTCLTYSKEATKQIAWPLASKVAKNSIHVAVWIGNDLPDLISRLLRYQDYDYIKSAGWSMLANVRFTDFSTMDYIFSHIEYWRIDNAGITVLAKNKQAKRITIKLQ